MNEEKEEVCCAKFDPTPWQEKEVTWHEKNFIKESMPQFLHMPIFGGFDKVVTRMMAKLDAASARTNAQEFLMLSLDLSPWKSELYINTTKVVPEIENVKISGTFLAKVFDGPFSSIPKFMREMDAFVESKNEKATKYYFYYTTCPKCAKKYGHNYMVIFAQIK